MILLLDKRRYKILLYDFLENSFDITDESEAESLLDVLCNSIKESNIDIDVLHDIIYSDLWTQGHFNPFTDLEKKTLMDFFSYVLYEIIFHIKTLLLDENISIKHLPNQSLLSLSFRVIR